VAPVVPLPWNWNNPSGGYRQQFGSSTTHGAARAARRVVHAHAAPFGCDQSAVAQLSELVADDRLGQSDGSYELGAVLACGELLPWGEGSLPWNEGSLFVDDRSLPCDDEPLPSDRELLPSGGELLPSGGELLPSGGEFLGWW
jgi:hypothetical protein